MLWTENPALLADSPAMQGRQFVSGALGDSPALRLTVEDDGQEGISMWNGDRDDLSLDMLTDVDEVLDEDVSVFVFISELPRSRPSDASSVG